MQPCRLDAATLVHGESASERAAVGELLHGATVQEAHREAERCAQFRFRVKPWQATRRVRQLQMASAAPLRIDPR
jgi:hypothetical protein